MILVRLKTRSQNYLLFAPWSGISTAGSGQGATIAAGRGAGPGAGATGAGGRGKAS